MNQSEIQQTNQLMSNAIQMQQNALDIGQEALDQAVEIPLKQSIELQRSAGKLFLNGLEMGSWLGNRSTQLTREALDTYFQTVDNAAANAAQMTEQNLQQPTQMTEQGLQQAGEFGQQQLRTQQQEFQPGNAFGGQQRAAGQQPMGQPPQGQQSAAQQPAPGAQTQQPVQGSQVQGPAGQQMQQPPGQQIQQPPAQQGAQPAPVQESQREQRQPPRQSRRQLAVAAGVPEEESGSTEPPVDSA